MDEIRTDTGVKSNVPSSMFPVIGYTLKQYGESIGVPVDAPSVPVPAAPSIDIPKPFYVPKNKKRKPTYHRNWYINEHLLRRIEIEAALCRDEGKGFNYSEFSRDALRAALLARERERKRGFAPGIAQKLKVGAWEKKMVVEDERDWEAEQAQEIAAEKVKGDVEEGEIEFACEGGVGSDT